jgi:exodeoxyribonuclease VII large subunit
MLNIPEFTVSEFSRSVKTLLEDAFGYVKINGEITGLKRAASGHLYFNLKDDKALLSAVCFRNVAGNIDFEIGDGLQVCAFGRITTFEGRSNYQIIVEKIEIAGIGAILEMIEKRRQKLLAEGLFDEIHKKKIPFFPKIIGVITSPTGAVIEDIKHRISARCPTHVILYPTLVQGEKAAGEIIAAIRFFNNLKKDRPEVLIIARGGGSFEDLLPFSDEALIREVFKSEIPIISAVGHETDTTLIDYVSDLRAPTPTAAAEFATPVISDLKNSLNFLSERLEFLPLNFLNQAKIHLDKLQKYIIDPRLFVKGMAEKFLMVERKLKFLVENFFAEKYYKLNAVQISKQLITQKLISDEKSMEYVMKRLQSIAKSATNEQKNNLENLSKLLQAGNHREILKRGFALVKNAKGDLIYSVAAIKKEEEIIVEVSDGEINLHTENRQFSFKDL